MDDIKSICGAVFFKAGFNCQCVKESGHWSRDREHQYDGEFIGVDGKVIRYKLKWDADMDRRRKG